MWWVFSVLAFGVALGLGFLARAVGGVAVYPAGVLAALIGATASVYAIRVGRLGAGPAFGSLVQSWAWPLGAIGSAIGGAVLVYLLGDLLGAPVVTAVAAAVGVVIGRVLDERLL